MIFWPLTQKNYGFNIPEHFLGPLYCACTRLHVDTKLETLIQPLT